MQTKAEYDAEWKWLQSSEAAKLSAAAKAKALSYFKQRYPNADMENFVVQINFDKNRKATGDVFLKKGGGQLLLLQLQRQKLNLAFAKLNKKYKI